MNIVELSDRTTAELHDYAKALKIPNYAGLRKHDLLFNIHRGLVEGDEPPKAEGVLDILPEGYGFLRSEKWSYVHGPGDIYVNPALIRRFALRRGDEVAGPVRRSKGGDRYLALGNVEKLNDSDPQESKDRPNFLDLRPCYPDRRLTLETPGGPLDMRATDIIAPIGVGQRGMIVSPPRAGKTTVLRNMAQAIIANHPDVHLMVLLIDERPEEATEMRDRVPADVIVSTFDEPASRHRQVAEMVLERARRLVEQGRDVAILLDSLTRLARAYNTLAPRTGRIMSGGVDAKSLRWPKQFFGSARNIVDGGSLTIIATALIETGSRMDEVIFEEFKGTGNMELVLEREIADHRIFPAIGLARSGTRREELLLSETELNRVFLLRNFLSMMDVTEAAAFLFDRMSRYSTNAEFLAAMAAGE